MFASTPNVTKLHLFLLINEHNSDLSLIWTVPSSSLLVRFIGLRLEAPNNSICHPYDLCTHLSLLDKFELLGDFPWTMLITVFLFSSIAHASTRCSLVVESMTFACACARAHFCKVLGKSLNLSKPHLSYCAMILILPYKVIAKANIMHTKCLAQCLVHNKCSINDKCMK